MKGTSFCVLALLFCGAGTALAQQYKWVDEHGRIRYGDVPPPGVHAILMKPLPQPAPAAEAGAAAGTAKKGPPTAAEQEKEYRKRHQEALARQDKEEKERADAAAKRENCERAQESLRSLESGQRIARFDPKGERYFADEKMIEAEKASARKIVQDSCN